MTPIPDDIVARWSPMWGHHHNRPWWDITGWMWHRKYDNITLHTCDVSGDLNPCGQILPNETHIDAIARIDASWPAPPPPPMPGQVWIVGKDEVIIPSLLPSGSNARRHPRRWTYPMG